VRQELVDARGGVRLHAHEDVREVRDRMMPFTSHVAMSE
jgi:hypothetical protein